MHTIIISLPYYGVDQNRLTCLFEITPLYVSMHTPKQAKPAWIKGCSPIGKNKLYIFYMDPEFRDILTPNHPFGDA